MKRNIEPTHLLLFCSGPAPSPWVTYSFHPPCRGLISFTSPKHMALLPRSLFPSLACIFPSARLLSTEATSSFWTSFHCLACSKSWGSRTYVESVAGVKVYWDSSLLYFTVSSSSPSWPWGRQSDLAIAFISENKNCSSVGYQNLSEGE